MCLACILQTFQTHLLVSNLLLLVLVAFCDFRRFSTQVIESPADTDSFKSYLLIRVHFIYCNLPLLHWLDSKKMLKSSDKKVIRWDGKYSPCSSILTWSTQRDHFLIWFLWGLFVSFFPLFFKNTLSFRQFHVHRKIEGKVQRVLLYAFPSPTCTASPTNNTPAQKEHL